MHKKNVVNNLDGNILQTNKPACPVFTVLCRRSFSMFNSFAYDANALDIIRNNCLMSVSVKRLQIHPRTMIARGCKAGLC